MIRNQDTVLMNIATYCLKLHMQVPRSDGEIKWWLKPPLWIHKFVDSQV